MTVYQKGSRAERELIQYFSSKEFSVIRAAGSGVNSLSPDLLAFRRGIQLAIESKAHEKTSLQLDKEQFNGLCIWQENTGITTLVAWRRNRLGWRFVPLSVFQENAASYSISWEKAQMIGKTMEEIIL